MRRGWYPVVVAAVAIMAIAAADPVALVGSYLTEREPHTHKVPYAASAEIPAESVTDQPCIDGLAAGTFACDGLDLLSFMPSGDFGALGDLGTVRVQGTVSGVSDVWGWTDPDTGDEIAMVGHTNGTAFIRVTDPYNPTYLGSVPNTAAVQLIWHDIKVVNDHAIIVSESNPHGMQILDLTTLRARDGSNASEPLLPSAVYPLSVAQHNVVADDETDFAYIVGGDAALYVPDECMSGLKMIDMSDPLLPAPAGCWSADGYVHDAQCLVYDGPDVEHRGREICALFAADHTAIVDVTDKSSPSVIARAQHPHTGYVHQGWFTEDLRYILANDELDESDEPAVTHTRTLIWDAADLDQPVLYMAASRDGSDGNPPTVAIDHNNLTMLGGTLGLEELLGMWDEEGLQRVLADTPDAGALLASLSPADVDALLRGPDFEPVADADQPRLDEKKSITCPHCGEEFTP